MIIRENQHEYLAKLAEITGESRSHHVRQALDLYFEKMRTEGLLLVGPEIHTRRPA